MFTILSLYKCHQNYSPMKPVDSNAKTLYVRTQHCFDVYTTSITLGRRRMNVKMTLCLGTILIDPYKCILFLVTS